MAYALVGTIGVASQGASGASVTPTWGTSENRTVGNLLICFCSTTGSVWAGGTPSGWSVGVQQASGAAQAYVFYKIATGTDAAPTLAGSSGTLIAAQLAEFSGNSATPLDKTGTAANATTSPVTATFASADTASGELILMCSGDFRSVARTTNDTWTSNNATITQAGNNNGASSVNHYSFGYSLATTSNASADTAILTASVTTSITGISVAGVTFKKGASVFTQSLTATLSPTAAVNRKTSQGGFVANLSFTGSFAASRLFLRAFTATLFQSGGALATDNFNRANSGTLGANWGSVSGLNQFDIVSNQADTSSGANEGGRYTAVSAPPDQYSKVTVTGLNSSTSSGIGPAVRMASGAVTMYLLQGNTTETTMFRAVAGSFTQIGSTAAASAVNDVLEIDAVGTTITGKKNGLTIIGPVTDTNIASGDFGIWASATGFTLKLDNWEGGSPGGGAVATLSRLTGKSLSATFTPIAALSRNVAKSLAATLTSTAILTKKYLDAGFTATLSFIGNLAVSKTFLRALTATLSFSGGLSRRTGKALSATLSFVSTVTKNIPRTLSATLSFTGTFSRQIGKALSATLSFVGNLAENFIAGGGHVFNQSLTATLSFAGAHSKLPSKAFNAILSSSASLVRRISRAFTAILTSAGALVKAIRGAGFSATLSFVGSLSTAIVHFFTKAFTATLSFAGAISISRRFARALSATLNMSGAFRRQLGKTFAATLSFSAALRKTIRKGFSATLSFIGFLFSGGAIEIIAGVITGALVRMGLAGSSARIGQAGSQLDIRETESEADSPTTGSSLRVERTK